MPLQSNDYALVIGINHYPRYQPLNGPIEDAKRMYDWLSDQNTGGGVPELNRRMVLSELQPGQTRPTPVQEDVDDALMYLLDRAQNEAGGKARRFYFYFAGHGLGLNTSEVGLCMPSWSELYRSNALMMEAYLRVIQESGLFGEIFFFLDCCRVRKISAEGHKPNIAWPKPATDTGAVQYMVGFATEYQNLAYEAELQPGGTDETQVRGLFTTALLEALNGSAARPEGGVTLAQLCATVSLRTTELVKALNPAFNQEPRFRVEFRESEKSRVVLGNALPREPRKGGNGFESTANTPVFRLEVKYPRETEVTVFNPNGEEVYRGYDNWSGEVEAGTVTVRTNHFGKVDQYPVVHRGDGAHFILPDPQVYTATLLAGAATSHEYQTGPAQRWSQEMTCERPRGAADSSFFLFLRHSKRQQMQGGLLLEQFDLLDEKLRPICRFSSADSRWDEKDAWQVFSMSTDSGQYYLRYAGQPNRLIPVFLFKGWQTQLFLLYANEKPLFETLRFQMSRLGKGFYAADPDARLTDLAHQCLQNVNIPVPPDMMQELLHGKFDNPMFGIIGAYLIVQRANHELSGLLPVIQKNLVYLLKTEENPDIQAISLLANRAVAGAEFLHPPMFAFGTDAVIRFDLEGKARIPSGSVFLRMTDQRQSDLVQTSWFAESAPNAEPAMQPWVLESLRDLLQGVRKRRGELTLSQAGSGLRLPVEAVRIALAELSRTDRDAEIQSFAAQLLSEGSIAG